jgi:hypothetical protein
MTRAKSQTTSTKRAEGTRAGAARHGRATAVPQQRRGCMQWTRLSRGCAHGAGVVPGGARARAGAAAQGADAARRVSGPHGAPGARAAGGEGRRRGSAPHGGKGTARGGRASPGEGVAPGEGTAARRPRLGWGHRRALGLQGRAERAGLWGIVGG